MRANPFLINVVLVLNPDVNSSLIKLKTEYFCRVILNLTKSAFNAMQDKINAVSSEYKAKLEIRTKDLKDKVLLEIEDKSSRAPEEIQDNLLMPFFTSKKDPDQTDQGLSVTHDIVKSHDGLLEIESRIMEFARLKILLPKA
jgi:two-component system, NtrC family, sensor kinase